MIGEFLETIDLICAVELKKVIQRSFLNRIAVLHTEGGTTVLFVSHSIEQIREMCDRAIWLENGSVKLMGGAEKVCDAYESK